MGGKKTKIHTNLHAATVPCQPQVLELSNHMTADRSVLGLIRAERGDFTFNHHSVLCSSSAHWGTRLGGGNAVSSGSQPCTQRQRSWVGSQQCCRDPYRALPSADSSSKMDKKRIN